MRTTMPAPFAAYLRVYEPLAAFPEPERSHWYGYASSGRHPTAQDELRSGLVRLAAVPPRVVPERESREAFVRSVDGVVHICPWRTRLRARMALREAPQELPQPLLEAAVPRVVREQAERDFDRWRAENPDARPWILGSCWQVPVRWFVLFADEERELAREPAALVYRTTMTRARQRTARALRVLREAAEDGAAGDVGESLAEALEQVGRWLEEFHPRSLVELDYGGLAHLLSPKELDADHSAEDVAAGLAALREGDPEAAALHHRRLYERWLTVQRLQFAN